jgi:hypothetical protein
VPTFIVAGYQKSITNQLNAALNKAKPSLQGWRWELFPSSETSVSRISQKQVNSLLEFAAKHGGAHIFGVNNQRLDANEVFVGNMIKRYFRLRWLPARAVGMLGGGDNTEFISALIDAIQEEGFWANNVQPRNLSSPLMLPDIFKATASLLDTWTLSESYNDVDNLKAAVQKIAKFESTHRRRISSGSKTPWVDEKEDWVWEDNGAPHGTAKFPKTWKYSFHAPNFHFDVQSKRKSAIFLDCNGESHPVKEYLNVTAHGEVMSAK